MYSVGCVKKQQEFCCFLIRIATEIWIENRLWICVNKISFPSDLMDGNRDFLKGKEVNWKKSGFENGSWVFSSYLIKNLFGLIAFIGLTFCE